MIDKSFDNNRANIFFSISSFAGLLAIYALKLSYDKKTAFDRNEFANDAYMTSGDYFFGFVVACDALGIITHNFKGNVITVTEINPLIYERIEDEVRKGAIENTSRMEGIKKIERYFS